MIDEWWLRRDRNVSLILMGGDKCSDVGWSLMFDVLCDVYSEGEFEAGWLTSIWLTGRLLRSAVIFGSQAKQYGHVPSIVVWLIHGPWSYVPNKWLSGHGTSNPSSWPQQTPVTVLLGIKSSHSFHTLWWWRAGDSNTPSSDYESDVLSIHYTSDTTHERVRLWRARRTRADAATRARATDLEGY